MTVPHRLRTRGGHGRSGYVLAFQLLLALAIILAANPAAASPADRGGRAGAAPGQNKVDRAVLAKLAAKGAATFFVVLRDRADLGPAARLATHAQRTGFVQKQLRDHAERSQARLRRLLAAGHAQHTPFWIANAVRVTAGRDLLDRITALPEVERVVADGHVQIPRPSPGGDQARIQTVEWNIDRIRAPEVWSTFGDRGDGIVVASIDTGVQFDHPALVRQYRGNLGGGSYDHNYNWFDPSQVCGSPSLAPCDNVGHGTHTTGTMVGGAAGGTNIGVAPGARWIAAKGCEDFSCSFSALLASGQWILAPTDLSGNNPRPDLAPNIVNNSWGGGGGSPFYQDIVSAWNAAGIFAVFANGNSGPGCGSAGSPGDYPDSYSAGAFDIGDNIAPFSSRGPSAFGGEAKPNLAAPGVDVRSSVPGGYASFNGTSMATPHVAGTVALIWSAAPSLLGQVAATRQLLDATAVDTENLSCGGTAADNNVWGEGRLDAFVAVDAAPRGPTGTLAGTVTNQATGDPVAGARIRALRDGTVVRQDTTGTDGRYQFQLPLGTYTIQAAADGYPTGTAQVVLDREDEFVTCDIALPAARLQVDPAALEFTLPPGQTRTKTLSLANTGTLDLTWQAAEMPVATGTNAGRVRATGPGVNSRTAPAGYAPKPAASVLAGGPTLVFMDALPWGTDALTQVLTANGIRYDIAQSSQMGSIDLGGYEVVYLSSDQPQEFYDNYAANHGLFADYVLGGGFLWVGAAAWGWNGGDFGGGVLPGGVTVQPAFEDANDVVDNAHPTVQGVPDPFTGSSASHAAFQNLPPGTDVIARGQTSGLATLVEYGMGPGRVLALGQTLEFGWQYGQDSGRILENGVPYAYAFEPVLDVPWLAENPGSGTLAPGARQAVAVTVDTAGLAPGRYRARIIVRSNDPLNPRLELPVSVLVPAYVQAVDAGGGDYTDRVGDTWSADRKYATGGFGYVNGSSRTARTNRPISGTDDDPLYQAQRVNPTEYRFDGLPAGVYEIDLGFAEVTNRQPGTRLFDVIAENTVLLPAHDVAGLVGSFAADMQTFRVPVTDGQLNLRFVERRGYALPIVNAIRVVHQPVG